MLFIISYSGSYDSSYPYLKSDYTYEFHINSDGEILKCYVYEKGFLNGDEKGDVFCKISYDKGESLIDSDLIDAAFENHKETLASLYPEIV